MEERREERWEEKKGMGKGEENREAIVTAASLKISFSDNSSLVQLPALAAVNSSHTAGKQINLGKSL